MTDTQFIPGLIVKEPRQGAPDFVIAGISIKVKELITHLQSLQDEWENVQIKRSKNGKLYAQRDTWKPDGGKRQDAAPAPAPQRQAPSDGFADDSIPF